MKMLKRMAALVVALALVACATAKADDVKTDKPADKPIPYPLKTCPVSDEVLGGEMGAPYVFVYKGQEIKLCCSGCKKDFFKDPDKYLKKIHDEAAKAAAQAKK